MKKSILSIASTIVFFITVHAQQNSQVTKAGNGSFTGINKKSSFLTPATVTPPLGPDKDYAFYKQRSRTQRTIGLTLLGVGLVSGVVGILEATKEVEWSDYAAADRADRAAITAFIISGATGIASIPFMILAHASKSKARAAMSTQKTFIPGKGDQYITGISLSIPIGK